MNWLQRNLSYFCALSSVISHANTPPSARAPHYREGPGLFSFVPRAFSDVPAFVKALDPRDNWREYLLIGGMTGILLALDQPILDGSQRFAKHIGLLSEGDDGRQTTVVASVNLFGIKAPLHVPRGPVATMYYLGDGLTALSIVGGLATYGSLLSDRRAQHTASQIMEALLLTGMGSVILKTSTGRESPFKATAPGGVWRPFPGPKRYLQDVPNYDAFPSGHVATLMATLRVLAENYPEKIWIRPLGYSALGLLSFGMLANGVHWASDYPLGMAMGYVAAGVVLQRRLPEVPPAGGRLSWQGFSPGFFAEGTAVMASWSF